MQSRSIISRLVVAFVLACLVVSGSGCYLGRGRTGKTVAYATNGAVAGVGLLMVTAQGGGDEEQALHGIGVVPLAIGIAGLALNLAVGTEQRQPSPGEAPAKADGTVATALR